MPRAAEGKAIQHGGKFGRVFGGILFLSRHGPDPGNGVIKRLAIGAGDGLNGKMDAFVLAAGDLDAITAPGTFERVSPAHSFSSPLDKDSR